MGHSEVVRISFVVFNYSDSVLHAIFTFWEYFCDSTTQFWADKDTMLAEQIVLVHFSQDVTTGNEVAHGDLSGWGEQVCFVLIQARKINATWNEHTS